MVDEAITSHSCLMFFLLCHPSQILKWMNNNGSSFIAGWTDHWDGPQSSPLPVGLHRERDQRGPLCRSHITQVPPHTLSVECAHGFTPHPLRNPNMLSLQQENKRPREISFKNSNRNWFVLHFCWKVLFLVWQLILVCRNTGCYKAFMKHEGILTDCCFFPPQRNCQY